MTKGQKMSDHIEYLEPPTLHIVATCRHCESKTDIEVTTKGFNNWRYEGVLIQRALPELSINQRELLISGTCGPCFDKMFPEERENNG
jgi:hypothetical protein